MSNEVLSQVVEYMLNRTSISNVIFVGNTNEISERKVGVSYYFVGEGEGLNEGKRKDLNVIKHDVAKGLPFVEKTILKDSIVIVDSVLTRIENSKKLLKDLSGWEEIVPCLLIADSEGFSEESSSVSREDFKGSLKKFNLRRGFYGYVPRRLYEEKTDFLYIGGCLFKGEEMSGKLKVCAIVSTYNEEDIIRQVCEYLLDQGIHIHIIDNWSTDSTLRIIRSLMEVYEDITYEIFPEKDEKQYVWFDMLNRKIEYAKANDYDWYMHYDADEIRESPWSGSLIKGIQRVDKLGYNAIDHTVIDFRPIENGFDGTKKPQNYFNYFEFGKRPGHFAQVKAWKNISGIEYNLSSSGGHRIDFNGIKIFPYKFLLRHYPLRSLKHMKKKVFVDRLPRFGLERKEYGWHTHYDQYLGKEEELRLWDKSELTEFDENFYENDLLERLFGINIIRE